MLAGTPLPRAHPGEPALWQRVFSDYWFWADRFNWPPDVVDRQSAVVLHRLYEVTLAVEEWRREQTDDG